MSAWNQGHTEHERELSTDALGLNDVYVYSRKVYSFIKLRAPCAQTS
jgi:hypothetical protein